MIERTDDTTSHPFIRTLKTAGGSRQTLHKDFWSVVKVDPRVSGNNSGQEVMLELVPMDKGKIALARALVRQSHQTHLPILKIV